MVEHHLAKVRVAGSNPVIRSEELTLGDPGGVAERRGKGLQIPVHGFKSRLHLVSAQRVSEVKKTKHPFHNGRLAQLASALP